MEEARKPIYRYCIVPGCKNTIRSTPDKVFFNVPRDAKIRKQWCEVIRRDEVSPTSCLHCCEDHFNIEEDTENYVQYNIMKQEGEKVTLRLNKGVLPHLFQRQKLNVPPPVKRMGATKKQRSALIEEALPKSVDKSSDVLEICEPLQTNYHGVGPNTSHIGIVQLEAGPSTYHIEVEKNNKEKLYSDKAVQVNIKANYRSKGVNVNFTTNKKNIYRNRNGIKGSVPKTAAERARAYRARKRAEKPEKVKPKTSTERVQMFRARKQVQSESNQRCSSAKKQRTKPRRIQNTSKLRADQYCGADQGDILPIKDEPKDTGIEIGPTTIQHMDPYYKIHQQDMSNIKQESIIDNKDVGSTLWCGLKQELIENEKTENAEHLTCSLSAHENKEGKDAAVDEMNVLTNTSTQQHNVVNVKEEPADEQLDLGLATFQHMDSYNWSCKKEPLEDEYCWSGNCINSIMR